MINQFKYYTRIFKWSRKGRVGPAKILFFTYSKNRKWIDGKNRNMFSFLLEQKYGNQMAVFERETGARYVEQMDSKKIHYVEWDYIVVSLRAKLNSIFGKDKEACLNKAYDQYFKRLLHKTNPKVVLLVCSYDIAHKRLAYQCKQQKITVVEIQHGVINNYGYQNVKSKDYVPDYFFSFGSYFSTQLKSLNMFSDDRVIDTGFPLMEHLAATEPEKLDIEVNDRPVLLFTTRLTSIDLYIRFIAEVESHLDPNWLIFVKLHPAEMAHSHRYEAKLKEDRTIIFSDATVNTFDLMKYSTVHSTINSTSFMESLFLGIPNIFIDDKDKINEMDVHIDGTLITKTDNAKEFADRCRLLLKQIDMQRPKLVDLSSKFYMKNSLALQLKWMEKLLNE